MVCAAALEVQRIIQQEDLVANVAAMGAVLETKLRAVFSNHPNIGDIRGRGLFWGVSRVFLFDHVYFLTLIILKLEVVASKTDKRPFESTYAVAMAIHEEGLRQDPGIMLYPGIGCEDGWKGDHVIVSPPYTINEEELDVIVDAAYKAIDTVCEQARRFEFPN